MTTGEMLPSRSTWDDWARALAERTAAVDRLVEATAAAELSAGPAEHSAVLAVGGYGRRELFPCSDVDLLLLFDSAEHAQASREAIERFLRALWDAGLRVSHSVRTPLECAEIHENNLELNISLLDERYLAGGRELGFGRGGIREVGHRHVPTRV